MLKKIFDIKNNLRLLFILIPEIFFFVLLSGILNKNSYGFSSDTCTFSWTPQTSGTSVIFNSVSSVSDLVCWAAGDGPTVRRTTDGGTGWTNATGTGIVGDIYSIYAFDANIAFCTTTPVFGFTPSFIYLTTNGGNIWIQVHATSSLGFINAIQMISPSEGYAIGDPENSIWTLLKTTNGGINWTQMPTAPIQSGTELGSNNSFFILGNQMWFGTTGTKVYHSTNLGMSWTNAPTIGTVNSFAVHFNDSLNGLTGGSVMLSSTNGGSSYNNVTSPGVSGNINGIEGSGTNWWAIRSGSSVYRSTDLGNTWSSAYNLGGATFNDLDFTDAGGCPGGWAVGNSGVIVKMTGTLVGINNFENELPIEYSLMQNYPNPFNPSTNINFSIPKTELVILKIYDIAGKEVATLINEVKSAGSYIVGFNSTNLTGGTYFYRLEAGSFADTKKMLIVK